MRATPFPQPDFKGHELLDSGRGEKLERFGEFVLRRPDPQALWAPALPAGEWEAADFTFVRESDRGGSWRPGPKRSPHDVRSAEGEGWLVPFDDATFRLRLTPFKHVGLFPEQAANWAFLRAAREAFDGGKAPRILNLFGYTGALSVVAAQCGFEVTHVDASRASLAWAVENTRASGLGSDCLRVVLEDALAFVRREVRRVAQGGEPYSAVVLDPPHYGRGPKGQKWQFERDIAPLLEAVSQLVGERALVVLSTYAIGFSPLALENLLADFPGGAAQAGELALVPRAGGHMLPAGFCVHWTRGLDLES